MPYEWTTAPGQTPQEMRLWPHQSLPARGFAAFVLATFTMILIPVFALIGTVLLWGLLPFVLGAVAAIYFALQYNHKSRLIEATGAKSRSARFSARKSASRFLMI